MIKVLCFKLVVILIVILIIRVTIRGLFVSFIICYLRLLFLLDLTLSLVETPGNDVSRVLRVFWIVLIYKIQLLLSKILTIKNEKSDIFALVGCRISFFPLLFFFCLLKYVLNFDIKLLLLSVLLDSLGHNFWINSFCP